MTLPSLLQTSVSLRLPTAPVQTGSPQVLHMCTETLGAQRPSQAQNCRHMLLPSPQITSLEICQAHIPGFSVQANWDSMDTMDTAVLPLNNIVITPRFFCCPLSRSGLSYSQKFTHVHKENAGESWRILNTHLPERKGPPRRWGSGTGHSG